MQTDKQTANNIVNQLRHAMGVLTQGRAHGIRVVATEEACEALLASGHPDAALVVANLVVVAELPGC
jgi:hypothetical protein